MRHLKRPRQLNLQEFLTTLSLRIEKSVIAVKDRAEIRVSGGPSGAVLMLLSHFKEDRTKMFHVVDKTCIADEVETELLPPTPCIIVCGK